MLPSFFLPSSGVEANPTMKLVSVCKFSPDSRHDLDPGIKKVTKPTFVPLRPKKCPPLTVPYFLGPLLLHKSWDEIS
jgi:hypothetical protein